MHTYILHTYMYIHTYIYTYMYITYIYLYIHTYIHTVITSGVELPCLSSLETTQLHYSPVSHYEYSV